MQLCDGQLALVRAVDEQGAVVVGGRCGCTGATAGELQDKSSVRRNQEDNSPTSCSIFNALSSTRILGPAQQSSRDEERETRTDTSPGRSPGKGLQASALSEAGQEVAGLDKN